MSFMAKIAAGAATLALAGSGLGMVGTLSASAATPSCGITCDNWYTQKFGEHFVLDDLYGLASTGNALILYQASNSDPAEDFVDHSLGLVSTLHSRHHGLFPPGFIHTYGTDTAIEIQYEPLGQNSNLCVGTWPGEAAQAGFKIRLEACGDTNTIFVVDEADASVGHTPQVPGPNPPPSGNHHPTTYTPLITGTDTNYIDPLVLNYPAGRPTDTPRPWLNVEPLSTFSHSSNGSVYDSQLWADKTGVLR